MDACAIDSHLFAGAADSALEMSPTEDEPGLWLGVAEGDEGFLGSLESGGALLNAGSWTISTLPGEEGLRWSGVKTELFDGWAGQTANGKQTDSSPLSTSTPKPKSATPASTALTGVVKPDPEDGWTESVVPVVGGASWPAPSASLSGSHGSFAKWPPSPLLDAQTPPPPAAATHETPATGSAATQTAIALPPQHVSARVAAMTGAAARTSAVATAAAAIAANADVTVKDELEDDEEEEGDDEDDEDAAGNRDRDSEEMDPVSELSDKRRRNREHAKRSRMRKRVRLGGLEHMVLVLRRENVRLRQIVKQGIPEHADDIIRTCASDNTNADIVAKQDVVQGMRPGLSVSSSSSSWRSRLGSGGSRRRPKIEAGARHQGDGGSKDRRVPSALKLMSPCYQSVKALAESQANFILTNPNLPDCPIIFASQGFLELTGYQGSQVIGKNCRFLQGPGTDPVTLSIIRNNLAVGRDTSVCIMNYKADGTPFWNQLSIGVLLDAHGQVANHVGVICEVNQMPPAVFHRLLHRVPLPESLLKDESSDSGDDAVERRSTAGSRHVGARSASFTGSSLPSSPRVVDRLRRTRAAAATGHA